MEVSCIPGQILGSIDTHRSGPGTHVFGTKIFASIYGSAVTEQGTKASVKPLISVPRDAPTQLNLESFDYKANNTLPVVGSIVLCRIIRVQQRQAVASILIVDPSPSSVTPYTSATNEDLQFQAMLRKEDVRAYEKDKIIMNDMFRVGDIVRASVISLGDERNYYISTAGNELGVVVAESEAGNAMIPASWKEMRDVVTGKGENRKVAKPT